MKVVRTRRGCGLHDFVIRHLGLEGHAIGRILRLWVRIKRVLCIRESLFMVHVHVMLRMRRGLLLLLLVMLLRIHG
jgi:hypothetical protein